MFENMFTHTKGPSRSNYQFTPEDMTGFPEVCTILDLGTGVPVADNLVEVTKEIELDLGENIRVRPVVLQTGDTFYRIRYDSTGPDYGATCGEALENDGFGVTGTVKTAWCNENLEDYSPQAIRKYLLPDMVAAVAGHAVKDSVRYYNKAEKERQEESRKSEANQPYNFKLAHAYQDASDTAANCLYHIFYCCAAVCHSAISNIAPSRDGICGSWEGYLDEFLAALRERLGHPIIVRDYLHMDGLNSGVKLIYKGKAPQHHRNGAGTERPQ